MLLFQIRDVAGLASGGRPDRTKRVELLVSSTRALNVSWARGPHPQRAGRRTGLSHDGGDVGAASAPPREAPVARVREAARPRGHPVLAPGRPARPRDSDQVHALGGVRREAQARALSHAMDGGRVRDHGRCDPRVRRAPVGRRGLRGAGHQRGRGGRAQPPVRARGRALRREPRVRRRAHPAAAGPNFVSGARFPRRTKNVRNAIREVPRFREQLRALRDVVQVRREPQRPDRRQP